MSNPIKPSKTILNEALKLAEEILENLELSKLPLTNIALKVSRLAHLLNDFEYQQIMRYEVGGYPSTANGVDQEVYRLAVMAGREYQEKDNKTGKIKNYIYTSSIETLERELQSLETALKATKDPDISISSSNPNQFVTYSGNQGERNLIRNDIKTIVQRLASRRSFIHSYVSNLYFELKFSDIVEDIFSNIRIRVDSTLGKFVPDSIQKLSAIYNNLASENPEDWSNAVHSCRRLLQALADAVYPPTEDIVKKIDGNEKKIKLGPDKYINRLIAFIEEHSNSERFKEIVGSHLSFIGDRLDSIFKAAQKGSHSKVSKIEAERYVIYTYLIVGDILSLLER